MAETPASLTLHLNGHDCPVIDSGTGPGVLLLHDRGGSAEAWSGQVPALVAAGFRAVAPTLRGLGAGAEERLDVGEALDDLRAIMRTLGVPRVHVVGRGRGGLAAWMFALTQAQRVDRLVVIDAPYPDGDDFAPVDSPVMAILTDQGGLDEASLGALGERLSSPLRVERLAGGDAPEAQALKLNELLLEFFARDARAARPAIDVRAMVGRQGGGALSDRLRGPDSTRE